ncbi:MAG TPA: DegT/DnrJ/EryC1/StrS family aminotransferase, partial [Longimicrobiaceae bacterium]|nr:DegT/DnrJ/EryC1/StrS family aminotransferase [Longimicrobiaceae bacterium]
LMRPAIGAARFLARRGWTRLHRVLEPARDDPGYRFNPDERAPLRPFMRRMLQLQLARLEDNVRRRRTVRAAIREALAHVDEVRWLDEDAHGCSNAAYFGIYVPSPTALARFLVDRGISTNPREFYDCGTLPQFAEYAAICPHSAHASAHLLRLPSYPGLGDEGVRRIAAGIEAFFARAPARVRVPRAVPATADARSG